MSKEKILIVEDEFIIANDLQMMLERAGYNVCGIAPSVVKALELITSNQPDWVLLDIYLNGAQSGIDLAGQLTEMGIPFIYISANTSQDILEAAKATLPYGFLVKPFREKDLTVMLDIAQYRHKNNIKYNKEEEQTFQQQIENILQKQESLFEKLKQLGKPLHSIIPFSFLWISRAHPATSAKDLGLQHESMHNFRTFCHEELLAEMSVSQRILKSWGTIHILPNEKSVLNGYDFRKLRMENNWIRTLSDHFKLESALLMEIPYGQEVFQFVFFSTAAEKYKEINTVLLNQFHKTLVLIIEDIIYGKHPAAIDRLTQKPKYITLPEESSAARFNEIIGNSQSLRSVFEKIEMVAPDDTSVLILGESGTGKEKIAQALHRLSPRKTRPMITVNCAALPLTLIESELFGHEKGAFTGAHDKRIGKFEQADGGSIFLDEIGELPLEAQVKLLRVLQEKEIERLGGTQTRKINVRIITATNKNLEKEVAEGRFRLDLYYRLNVFPIELPALRKRKEDIPALVHHFMDKYNKNTARPIKGISSKAMYTLQQYDWPGNIRELEHLIERSMLLSKGTEITEIDLPANHTVSSVQSDDIFSVKTMHEMERDHIMSILKMCNGKVFGPGGAAEILNIPSTTLNSKIKKLGIKYEFVK
jgi:DNA-binding NtrC family response regulator